MSVRSLKLGSYGQTLAVNAAIDISTATSYQIEFTKPSGDVVVKSATLGVDDLTGTCVDGSTLTFLANQYTTYVTEAGFLDEVGCWLYRGLDPFSSSSVPGDFGEFHVKNA